MDACIDANGHRTTWERDGKGRVTREVRADGETATVYTYDGIGRVITITDPKQQVTTHTYTVDDRIASTVYSNAEVATPGVSFTYDDAYPRVATMVDGSGTTSYTYQAAGELGQARWPASTGRSMRTPSPTRTTSSAGW